MNKTRVHHSTNRKKNPRVHILGSAVLLPGVGRTYVVRLAKTDMSDMVASGEEVMPMNTGPSATDMVRADRDARGW